TVFRVDMTAASVAEPVVHTARSILVRAGVDRRGPRKRMPAERARGVPHLLEEPRPPKRRHRVVALAWTFEDIAGAIDLSADVARLARDADLVFHLVVVGLEIVVPERPVLDGRSLGNARAG